MLSDWFSRDDEPQQQVALRKKPNPRNIANAAKAIELERELERYGPKILDVKNQITDSLQAKKGATRMGQPCKIRDPATNTRKAENHSCNRAWSARTFTSKLRSSQQP